ncbi:hypothetical protein LCGC14_1845840 [marine sediment metagenome]|uniref:Uncharacterized protein n=1 Tax=marine sediment metagenome TaxID=412755 RepID=A0A0F9IRH2_9ZZZZ
MVWIVKRCFFYHFYMVLHQHRGVQILDDLDDLDDGTQNTY